MKSAKPTHPGLMRETPIKIWEKLPLLEAAWPECRQPRWLLWLRTGAGVLLLAIAGGSTLAFGWTHAQLVNLKLNNQPDVTELVAGSSVNFSIDVHGGRTPKVLLHYSVDEGNFFRLKEFAPGATIMMLGK